MATCHDDLGNLHTEPAGLQTGDMGERNPTAQAGSSPLQSLLGHTQPQTLSPSPTSETAHLSSPRARPDLAPDSWRSGTRTTGPAAREAQRGFLASARDARVRQRKAPGTRRAGAPGLPERDVPATHRGDAATQAKAARGPAADPRAHRGAAWAGCRCSPQERGAHLCFMLLCPRGRRGHPAARRDTQPQPPRASPQRPARQQRRRQQQRRRRGGAGTWEGGGCGPPG